MNDDGPGEDALEQLRQEHRLLDEHIAALIESGETNQIELARMKKRKLHLKDRIAEIIDRNTPDIIA